MAYQVRQRDPIFPSDTQEMIERRGQELIGLALLGVGVLAAMIVGSYSPEDPGWLAATTGEVHNLLGRVGAAIASPLAVIIGVAAWGLAIAPFAWGLRFVRHRGADRLLGRIAFVPIAIALASIHASTLLPAASWTHSFGMGGLFGDTVSGAILGLSPLSPALSLRILSFVSALAMLAAGLYALGFDRDELRRIGHFLLVGMIMAYALVLRLLGQGARSAAVGALATARRARTLRARKAEEAAAPADDDDDLTEPADTFAPPPPLNSTRVLRADPPLTAEEAPAPSPRPGFLSRVPGLRKRTPEHPVQAEAIPVTDDLPEGLEGEDRIRAKINMALKNRVRHASLAAQPATPARHEPPLGRPRGPRPMILDTTPPVSAPPAGASFSAIDPAPEAPQPAPEATSQPAPAAARARPSFAPVVEHKPRKPAAPSARARAEAQPALQFEEPEKTYEFPPPVAADRPRHGGTPPPVGRGPATKRPDAGNRAGRLRRQGRNRQRPPRPGGHDV